MRRKVILSFLALFFLLASNLHLCCSLRVNGRELEGLYSPSDLDRCEAAAAVAAEEILESHAFPPLLERDYKLSFIPPAGGLRFAADAILRGYSGVEVSDGVYVNGVFLGTVESGELIREKLKDFILDQMPNRAVFGSISGRLDIRPVYTRSNSQTNDEDMLLLISGMAPVHYIDSEGRLA